MDTKQKNTLPKSRAELRERYKTKYVPQIQSQLPCCQQQPLCNETCQASYQAQIPYYPQHTLRQCLHAPYNCITHRIRGFWCPYCTSTYMFPELHCNHSPYVSCVNSQIPLYNVLPQSACALPQTACALPQSACALPQTACTLPQTACALPQTTCALPQTTCALPQTTCALPQTTCARPQ